jgi:hypothetical protein
MTKDMKPMNTTTKYLSLVLLIVISASIAFAQKVATTSMQFLEVMPCARGTALGDAYTVWAQGAEAVFWNPSGVAQVQNQELSATYTSWIFDARQGGVSYAAALGNIGAVGLQIQYVDYGMFDEASTDPAYLGQGTYPGLTGRQFHPYAFLAGVSYAQNLTDKFAAGVTVKFAHESLFDQQTVPIVSSGGTENVNTFANGLLFDFGLRYSTGFRTIQIAASVQNFGAQIKYATQSSPAPLLFRVGMAADVIGNNSLLVPDDNNRVGIAFDLFQPNDYTQQQHVGIEYEYAGAFALRAGYKFNYDTQGFTAGGGVRENIGGVRISLDYSYGAIGMYLGNVHRISLGAGL